MFAFIKGKLDYKGNDHIIIEANGIGYKVSTSLSTIEKIGTSDSDVKVFTHLYVREDIVQLYGFLTREELSMFELLITVSGVGPKAAASLLSAVSPSRFALAVITDDAKTLIKAQGIGNKMAQRIILELKDKIKKEQLQETGASSFEKTPENNASSTSEAVSALMVLGYTPLEASRAVSAVYSEEMDVETVIKNALKGLAK